MGGTALGGACAEYGAAAYFGDGIEALNPL
jgi:hypothetical protein